MVRLLESLPDDHQAFDPQLFHEVYKPLHVPRRFDPHTNRSRQFGIRLPYLVAFVLQSRLHYLAVAMVEAKMRSPREIGLGPDGIQRLFSVSGVLSADTGQPTWDVQKTLRDSYSQVVDS